MNVDLIIHNAAQLVTCAGPLDRRVRRGAAEMGELGIIENGAVAVRDGLVVGCGASDSILRDFTAAELFDAGQKVVCPGFVDCHTHVVYAGNRLDEFESKIKGADYLEILRSGGGILSTVRHTREAGLEKLVAQSAPRLDRMLAHGTCTAEVKTGYGLDAETEFKMLAAVERLDQTHPVDLIPTFLAAHAVPPEYKDDADGYVRLVCEEMIPRAAEWWSRSSLAAKYPLGHPNSTPPFSVDVFCEKNAFDVEQSRRIMETARKFRLSVRAHVDEFTNLGGARLAMDFRALSIDHLDATSAEEISRLARSETVGVVTPAVNFNFGSPDFADARRMIDAGCAIALATDYNPGSAPCPSLPNVMAIACRYQKLTPAEALNAATINAAHALYLSDKFGSLEPGKFADALVLDADDYRELAYEFGGNHVLRVFKKGRLVGAG